MGIELVDQQGGCRTVVTWKRQPQDAGVLAVAQQFLQMQEERAHADSLCAS